MVIRVRDTNRNLIGLFGNFESLIWTERYQDIGDFSLVVPLTDRSLSSFQIDHFIEVPTSKNLMVIEKISIDIKNSKMTITGGSLESILNRRVIYEYRNVDSEWKPSSLALALFDNAIANPKNNNRKIDGLYFEPLDEDGVMGGGAKTITSKANRGDFLGTAFYSLCRDIDAGLKAEFDQRKNTVTYSMYYGADKTDLVFSKSKHNFDSSESVESYEKLLTSILVAGEGEGNSRKMITVSRQTSNGEEKYVGILRRESFLDARDLQKGSSESLTKYKSRLKDRAVDSLDEYKPEFLLDGTILNFGTYQLNRDYGLGDMITIKEPYIKIVARISEVIQSWSPTDGYTIYPTFELVTSDKAEIDEEYNIE